MGGATAVAWLALASALVAGASAAPPTQVAPRIAAVGDLACQSLDHGKGTAQCQSGAIADLVRTLAPDRFLPLGDLQYANGKLTEFQRVWDLQFGDLKPITAPIPGNHEYGTDAAQGYFDYFGAIAHPPLGYYSYDLGAWHLIALDSTSCGDDPGCGPGSAQYDWLAADLAASDAACTLVYAHHPYYDWRPFQKWIIDDGRTRNSGSQTRPYRAMWELMVTHGVDVVLVAHNHVYQRWAPQDADGNATTDGIAQFLVGTGGRSLYPYGSGPRPSNLLATQNDSYGLLAMTLHATSYDFEFKVAEGQRPYQDAGAGVACH